MTLYRSANRGVPFPLLVAESVDETASDPVCIPNSFHNHKIAITGSAGVATGVVQIESAPTPNYSGTWNPVTSPITVVALTTIEVTFEGIYQNVRTRISTAIGGGTVSTEYVGS